MTGLCHIITYYVTIIRYYFSYYFSYYDTLIFIIFPIIFNYDRVVASGKWQGADSNSWPKHGGMTQQCLWRMPAHLHWPEGTHTEWKECSCTIIRIIFSIIRIICLAWPWLRLLYVCPRHCLSMYTDSVCCNELMGHPGSCQCCLKCPNSSAHMQLFHIMSLLLQLFFQLYTLFQNKKSLFQLDFIADNRLIAESIMHDRCS